MRCSNGSDEEQMFGVAGNFFFGGGGGGGGRANYDLGLVVVALNLQRVWITP